MVLLYSFSLLFAVVLIACIWLYNDYSTKYKDLINSNLLVMGFTVITGIITTLVCAVIGSSLDS